MTQTMIWYVIAGVLLALFAIRSLGHSRAAASLHRHHHHIVEIGSDNEMFYVPGDIRREDADDDF